jgi:hypothetical protein
MSNPFYKYLLTVFVCCVIALPSISQDSLVNLLDSTKIYYFHFDFNKQGPGFLNEIDTLINDIQKYNPLIKSGKYYATLGNVGLAHKNLDYNTGIQSGYRFGIHSFDKYWYHNDSILYYWVGKPYTHLNYIMGPKKEQNLHIDHSQNIASWFNLGLDFKYTYSPGYYLRQQSDDKNFIVKTRFQTRNYRYMVLGNYIHNKIKVEENGGIRYDSVFEDNTITRRDGIEVNLTSAKNRITENAYYIKQIYSLSGRQSLRAIDTTKVLKKPVFNPGTVSLSSYYSRKYFIYEQDSTNNGFYQNVYDTLINTYDSLFITKIKNRFTWSNVDNRYTQRLNLSFSIEHQYISLDDTIGDKQNYSLMIPAGNLKLNFTEDFNLNFTADYVLGNNFGGDYSLKGEMNIKTPAGKLNFYSYLAMQEAGNFFWNYSSNHFRWNQPLNKQVFFVNGGNYNFKNLTLGIQFTNISSFVYSDTNALPAQSPGQIQLFKAHIRKLFQLGKWSFDTRLIYQHVSDENVLRLPELIADLSFYYTTNLFQNAAILQTGFDATYHTAYFADAYMPATRSFYLQNEKKIGDYPFVNVFLNLQIKRARLFIAYFNMVSLTNNYNYYTVPSYPMQDDGYRFGVSWMFYD